MFSKKLIRLFAKTFGITVLISAIIVSAGYFTLQQAVKPPVIADASSIESTSNDPTRPAFFRPEIDETEPETNIIIPEPPDMAERKRLFYTFLVIGLDEGINTDTIMVGAYDGIAKQAYVIGIPRDSKVNVSFRPPKINATYMVGTYRGGGMEGGINRLKLEIHKIMGFVPDYHIVVDLEAFMRIIDTINGIEIDVPFDMVYDDPYQNLHINIPKGLQTLYGEDALYFARFRMANKGYRAVTDYQRIENQQIVMQAVLAKLLRPATFLRVPEYIEIFNEHVHTDIKLHEMAWFAEQLNEIRGNENALQTYTIPTSGTDGSYEFLDKEAIVELVNRTVNPHLRDITAADLDIAGR